MRCCEAKISKKKKKKIYDVNFSELTYEIARFNKLEQSSGTAF